MEEGGGRCPDAMEVVGEGGRCPDMCKWSVKEEDAREGRTIAGEGEDDGSGFRIDVLMIVQIVRESGRRLDATQLVRDKGRRRPDAV